MRIGFVIHNRKGTGPYFKVLEQCSALALRGHDITLFCTSRENRLRAAVEYENGVRVFESPDLLWGELRQGADLYNALRRSRFAADQPFDIVHAIDCRPNVIFPALYIKRLYNIPMVLAWWDLFGGGGTVTERSGKLYSATVGRVETWFEEYFRKYADGALTITTYLAERLASMDYPQDKIMIQHVGCDSSVVFPGKHEARMQLGMQGDIPTLCFIGTIYKSDLNILLKALDIVKLHSEFRVLWIGNYPIADDICREYNIIRTGYLKTSGEVYTHLAAADICLLPFRVNIANKARWHSKVSDYFNASRPVVSTPVSDFPEIFARNDVGWMAASDDPREFANTLLQAIHEHDYWDTKGNNAKAFVKRELDVGVLAGQLLDFYGKLLRKEEKEMPLVSLK